MPRREGKVAARLPRSDSQEGLEAAPGAVNDEDQLLDIGSLLNWFMVDELVNKPILNGA